MSIDKDPQLPPPREPELFASLIDEACAAMRTAERMTPRMEVALPDLHPTMVTLAAIVEQVTSMVRFLRRRAEDPAWLAHARGGDVADTLERLVSAWDTAVGTLTIASGALSEAQDQARHLRRWIDLAEYGWDPEGAPRTDRPEYRSDALPSGPFEGEPFELERLLSTRPDGTRREPHHRDACAAAWLVAALLAHGVVLGAHDRFTAALLAGQSPATVQVVTGWLARTANTSDDRGTNEESSPAAD